MNKLFVDPAYLWMKIITILSSFLIFSCSQADQHDILQKAIFKSDVVGVEENMLYPKYWTSKITKRDSELLSAEQIRRNNNALFDESSFMTVLENYPTSANTVDITKKILKISSPPSSKRFYEDGTEVTKANYQAYKRSLNLKALSENKLNKKDVKFGMVVRRTSMRTYPTMDRIFKTITSTNLDRFQETALFPTEVVAILHESLDKKWFFAISYNYQAWVKKTDIAIGNADEIFDYKHTNTYLVVTANKIQTSYNPDDNNISELQIEMGTVLPLVPAENIPTTIGGQNTYASHVISLPVRSEDGSLEFKAALVARGDDVHLGFLPYTEENLINQSFKFLGERYGWGHSYNARDCTGFVGEIYKSFGILMPRNSGQQGKSEQGINAHFLKKASKGEKLKFVKSLSVGDLIYIPGHVMMVLGFEDDKPYIIHDVSGLSYYKENGDYYKSALNGVSITPLLPMQLSEEKSYLDKIYNIKKIK